VFDSVKIWYMEQSVLSHCRVEPGLAVGDGVTSTSKTILEPIIYLVQKEVTVGIYVRT